MSTSILLIRHAAHSDLGQRLSGRGPAPGLTDHGKAQASRVAELLAGEPIDAIQSSPQQRAQQTADAIARAHGRAIETVDALDEVDFGSWTGRRYDELAHDPAWERWNRERSTGRAPGAESMADAQERVTSHVRDVARRNEGKRIAMVSHCDVIRALIAGALGLSLDNILKFDADPASVSRVTAGEWGMHVVSINEFAGR